MRMRAGFICQSALLHLYISLWGAMNCAPTLCWGRLEAVPVVGGIGNDVRGVVGQRNERMSL